MRIVILTQDDPFYLGPNLDYFLQRLPSYAQVVGTVVFDVSPFGKRESFLDKIKRTYDVFGFSFVMRYGMKFIQSKLDSSFNVRKVLMKYNIPLIEIEGGINKESNIEKLAQYKPDLLVSIAGNQIFKRRLLDLAPQGCINLHTALLPKYRGLMPSFWVLRFNEKETGVSVFFVDEGIDTGPIIVQKRVEIGNRSQEALIKYTKQLGMDAILESIDKIHTGTYTLLPNDDAEMTYFSFPTREDVKAFRAAKKQFY